jgi:hypothetical protein
MAASSTTSKPTICVRKLRDDCEDLALGHNQQCFAIDLDFAAGVLRKEDTISLGDLVAGPSAARQKATVSNREDSTLLGLLLSGIGEEDSAGRGIFGVEAFDNDVLA